MVHQADLQWFILELGIVQLESIEVGVPLWIQRLAINVRFICYIGKFNLDERVRGVVAPIHYRQIAPGNDFYAHLSGHCSIAMVANA